MNSKRVNDLLSRLQKEAAVPAGPPMDPAMMDPAMAGGAPPMDPAAMGMPPMDPAMAGGAPPMDPAMAGGAPPMDPAMAGGAPPMDPAMAGGAPPMDPAAMGMMPVQLTMQDLEALVTQLTAGQEERMASIEQKLDQIASAIGQGSAASPASVTPEEAKLEEPSNLLNEGLTDEVQKTASSRVMSNSEKWHRDLAIQRERSGIVDALRKFKVIV